MLAISNIPFLAGAFDVEKPNHIAAAALIGHDHAPAVETKHLAHLFARDLVEAAAAY